MADPRAMTDPALPLQRRKPSLALLLSGLASVSIMVGLASTMALHAMGLGV
jgi:hypothetical protein